VYVHTGDVLVHLLKQLGVEYVFGVPGGQTLPFYNGLEKDGTIKHITTREERTAAYAATAYARVTNKVGVCDATVGPGATQFPSGLAEAYNSSIPIVAILSDLPVDWEAFRHRGAASQGLHQLDMVKPFVKWCGKVNDQKALPSMVRMAFLKAVSGRPGPTVLAIPEDIFKEEWPYELPTIPKEYGIYPLHRPVADELGLKKAVDELISTKKVVIVAGGGAMISGAEEEVKKLAETLAIPVLQTFSGRGVLPDDHPMGVGLVGSLGTKSAKKLFEEADLCFLIGFKSGQNSTFTWELPKSTQKIIHLDIDGNELGKVFETDIPLAGDAKASLEKLNRLIAQEDISDELIAFRKEWVKQAKDEWETFKKNELETGAYFEKEEGERLKPQLVLHFINEIKDDEDILVCDASFASGWGAVYFNQTKSGRKVITPRGIAGLGAGLPMAIGVKFANFDKNIFLLAGDGGFAYSLCELATLKAYGLKLTIVIIDNEKWGWMEFINKINYGKESFALEKIDYARVAEGFGFKGIRVKSKEELKAALEFAKASDETVLIHTDTFVWETPVLGFREYLENPTKKIAKYM
jgi:acetolactate synthase I/II/III large subunit